MIYLSIGMPGRFADWCDQVVTRSVGHACGPVEFFSLSTLEDFAAAALRATSPYVVVISRQPVARLRTAFALAEKRLIVSLDTPRQALADAVLLGGMEFLEAVRLVATSCSALAGCSAMPQALVLDAGQGARDPAAMATSIAAHLELDIGGHEIGAIVADMAAEGILPHADGAEAWWEDLGVVQRGIAQGALGFYDRHLAAGRAPPITWERALFFVNEESTGQARLPANRPVDITGRPRCVLYGPYITLPPGAWSAAVALGFSREASEIPYKVEIATDRTIASVDVSPGTENVVEAHLDFTIDESADHPVEVRIWNERAAFEGQVALGHVTVAPQGHIRSETLDYFATALSDPPSPASEQT